MALTGPGLAALVFADHLSLFPTALAATRENPATGVLPHVIPEEFIGALCEGFVNALLTMVIKDIGSGANDLPGTAIPVPFVFPAAPAAAAQLIATLAWTGPQAAGVASVYITSVLTKASTLGLLQMKTNPLMGTGLGLVTPASNPDLLSAMTAALNTTLPLAFQNALVFGEGDVPGAPVNAILAAQLPAYAAALATGVASLTASVAYVGTTATVVPVSAIINTGNIL